MNTLSNYRALFIVFAIIAFGATIEPIPAQALTLTPTRFELEGDPGETLAGEMLLMNENDTAETFYLSFANFEAQGDSGDPAFTEPEEGLGTWITVDSNTVSLAPRQQKTIPFEIAIPEGAEPGGHFAVIFWGTSPSEQGQVSIGSKTGILVLLSVRGDVKEDAGLTDFNTEGNKFFYSALPVPLEYRIRNDGGDRIKPEGEIVIRNTLFLPTERLDANPTEGNVLPGSVRKMKVSWQNYERAEDRAVPSGIFGRFRSDLGYQWKNFALGLYSANLKITYGSGEEGRETAFFFLFPWQLVLVILLILIIVIYGGKILISRYNNWIIKKAEAGKK